MIFELVVTLCLVDACLPRVVPNPAGVQTEAACMTTAHSRAHAWAAEFSDARITDATCMPLEALADRAADVVETAPGHFVHFGKVESINAGSDGDVANTGFIIGDTGVAVIDSGTTRANGEALYLAMRQQTELPVTALIITHMHPDHVLGASVFRQAGATVISSAKMPLALAQRADGYLAGMDRLIGVEQTHATQVIYPEITVEGDMTLDLGNRVLALKSYATAHTDNDLTVLDTETSTMWMGDLVFLEHTPALDGSINGWIDTLTALSGLPITHMVAGHGRMIAPFPEGAKPTLAYLEAIRTETRAALEKGVSLSQAIRHIGNSHAADWQMFDEFNPRNATSAYVELEWE
jgi:quinoprotein relay system zinc metallohydrolase 2